MAWNASQYTGTANDEMRRAKTSTATSGFATTSDRAATVASGAAMRSGFRPTRSEYRPSEPDRSTSASADAEPIRPRTTATRTGSRPDARSAGGSAVPMTPKQALCIAETRQISGTDSVGGFVDGVGGGATTGGDAASNSSAGSPGSGVLICAERSAARRRPRERGYDERHQRRDDRCATHGCGRALLRTTIDAADYHSLCALADLDLT
mmetsp:Transcript_686/g.2073  ORF Transcript_686/g.2073 Transcript_686/m.2073 type:complete len:209 (-) Transcript_686:127-753(-)